MCVLFAEFNLLSSKQGLEDEQGEPAQSKYLYFIEQAKRM